MKGEGLEPAGFGGERSTPIPGYQASAPPGRAARLARYRRAPRPESTASMTHETLPIERCGSEAPQRASRRGTITIFSILTTIILIGVMGLGLDTALVMTARQQLQRTADAASLAAAAKLRDSNETSTYTLTRGAAISTAQAMNNDIVRCGPAGIALNANTSNSPTGDIVVGRWRFDTTTHQFVFEPRAQNDQWIANAVAVRALCASGSLNSSLELMFSAIFGATNTSNVGRYAIAQLGRRPDPLILILHRTQRGSLLLLGGVRMDVLAGTVQVDSDDACAFEVNGTSGLMEAQTTRVVGHACLAPGTLTGDLIPGSPYVPDPLINLPPPDPNSMVNRGGITGPGTYLPGYYPDGVNFNNGTAFLESGIYVIGKNAPAKGIDLKGDAVLESRPGGVLIYTEPGAGLTTSGSASGLRLSPMLSGTYNGVTVFMARTGNASADIGGLGNFVIRGTLYVPNGGLDMHGNVDRTVGRIIVETQRVNGNAHYVITGDDVPPPGGPQYVFLVN